MAKRGDLYFIRYYGDNGRKGRGRPAVIVSSEEVNLTEDAVMVAYLSTQPSFDGSRTCVDLTSTGRDSVAVVNRVTSLPKYRLGDYIGHITPEEEAKVNAALCIALGL